MKPITPQEARKGILAKTIVKNPVRRRNPLRSDPTRTGRLRKKFERELRRRFAKLRLAVIKLIVSEDALGLEDRRSNLLPQANELAINQRWRGLTNPDKIKEFKKWLETQIDTTILGAGDEAIWAKYIEDGFRQGAGRSWDDVIRKRAIPREAMGFIRGSRQQFLQSAFAQKVSVEKVKLLAGRTFTDLEGITQVMSKTMVRTLTDGLVRGQGPREIGRILADEVEGIGLNRATTLARTEIVRAHAEGQLQALEDLGVEEIGVAVEWSITDDDKVCELCEDLQGIVLKTSEAHGMLPRHPN